MEREVFEADGILVGWMCETTRAKVFIPRRDEDIKADRTAIHNLFQRAA